MVASPLIGTLDAQTERGRLVVTPELTVPGAPGARVRAHTAVLRASG